MALFQRIKTPFAEGLTEDSVRPRPRLRSAGELLRDRREELDLDLDSVASDLCIKPTYLAALEQDRSHELPGAAYALGFIRAYAQHLGLDADAILARFKEESSGLAARPDLSLPVPLGERSLPGAAMLLVALILALCGYGTWYYLSTGERSRPERVAEVPAALQPPLPGQSAAPLKAGPAAARAPGTAAGAGGESAPAAPSAPGAVPTAVAPPAAAAAAAITITAVSDCWVQVRGADNAVIFARVLKTGETYKVPTRTGLFLRTGNAGALQIDVNGKPVPPIGEAGMLRRKVALDPSLLLAGTAVQG